MPASTCPAPSPAPSRAQGQPVLEATTLSCCTSGVSSLPAFSLLLLAFLRRPAGGAVCKSPRLGGSVLPRRRYRASISRFCWLCSSEISRRCLQGGAEEGWVGLPGPGRTGAWAAQRSRHLFQRLPVYISTTWDSRGPDQPAERRFSPGLEQAGLFVLVFLVWGEAGVWTPSHIYAHNINPVRNHSD